MLYGPHLRLLKKISKKKIIREKKPNKDLDYLYQNGFIEITEYDKPGDYFAQPYITEKGKAELYASRAQNAYFWIPILISAAISVASLINAIIERFE